MIANQYLLDTLAISGIGAGMLIVTVGFVMLFAPKQDRKIFFRILRGEYVCQESHDLFLHGFKVQTLHCEAVHAEGHRDHIARIKGGEIRTSSVTGNVYQVKNVWLIWDDEGCASLTYEDPHKFLENYGKEK